ncbi:Antibiotic biosynthesis monooxygenase [Tepidimonas thermarum]|uniref:Antibiotic biosynthesis monooxygenase n=1 Tax=Tepidimonas thermarum TaxID=335431 RepID=A0A554WZ14_9BURK|nr:antibiotic biosynthesis monooxygenase [Tepidimonas thermarum]TSE28819.1 Antibiotic biosynthesis monooxygenase [Tepidimonas thermarum]
MTTTRPAHAVMVLVSRRARPGHEAALEATWARLSEVAATFPGYVGGQLIRPGDSGADGDERLFHMLFAFDNPAHLRAWQASPARLLGLQALEPHVEGHAVVRELSGLDHWFTPSATTPATPPPRWKVAVVTWLGIYPTVLFLFLAVAPWLDAWPLPLRTAVITCLVVVLMTWLVAPTLTRWLRPWLHARPTAT